MSSRRNIEVTIEDPSGQTAEAELDEETWIANNITQRRCNAIIPDLKKNRCQCGLALNSHGDVSPSPDETWDFTKHTIQEPTWAFGEVGFLRTSRTAKYARIDATTPIESVEQLLFKQWKLAKPQLILSVTGAADDFNWDESKSIRFQHSIARVVESAGAWVISGGTYSGVMELVGNAMKRVKTTVASETVCLGIATWGVIEGREGLENKSGDKKAKWCPEYVTFEKMTDETNDTSNQTLEKDKSRGEGKAYLDPNGHTHFLLVDDGTSATFGREIKMRSEVEKKLKECKVGGSTGVKIPACMVVLQGGPGTLNTVAGALKKNMAVVIIRENESEHNAITLACDFVDMEKIERPDVKTPRKLQDLTEEHQIAVINKLKALNTKYNSLHELTSSLDECIANRRFITLYSATAAIDLEAAIVIALLNTEDKFRNQMFLAIAWNRLDIVRQYIPAMKGKEIRGQELQSCEQDSESDSEDDLVVPEEDVKQANEERKRQKKRERRHKRMLEELFFCAVRLNRNDFLKAMIELVNLKVAVNAKRLHELYKQLPRSCLLRELLPKYNNRINETANDVEVSLYQVGLMIGKKVLSDALGHRYHPESLEQSQYYVAGKDEKDLEEDYDGSFVKTTQIRAPYDPVFDLFEYAVLLNRLEQSMFFFERLQDGLTGAVYAINLLTKLKHYAKSTEERKAYEKTAIEFESSAMNILKHCYKADPAKTRTLLIRKSKQVNGRTVMQLTMDSNALRLVAHQSVTSLTDDLWMGYIGEPAKISTLGVVAASCIFPPVLYYMKYVDHVKVIAPTPKRHSEPSWTRKILYFYNAPITIYLQNFMSYCIFLILLSAETLLYYGKGWSQIWLEILLIVWIGTLFCEEVRNALARGTGNWRHRLMTQLKDGWRIVQLLAIGLFYLGAALTFVPSASEASLSAGRIFEAVSLLLFFFRIYKYYAIDRKLGPWMITMRRMLRDLAVWTAIVLIIIIAWGVAQYSLLFPHSDQIGWSLIRDILVMPFWQMFTQSYLSISGPDPFDSDGARSTCSNNSSLYATYNGVRCADNTGQWIVPIGLGVYVVVTVLLMFNILIAMFVYTFDEINKVSEETYQYQRFELVSQLTATSPLVPPFVIFYYFYLVIKLLVNIRNKNALQQKLSKSTEVELEKEEERYLLTWLKGFQQEYWKIRLKKEEKTMEVHRITEDLKSGMNTIHTGIVEYIAEYSNSIDYLRKSNAETNGMLRTMLTVLGRIISKQQANELDQSKQILTANRERRAIFNTHEECRNQKYPGTNQIRTHVPDNKLDWNTNWPKYHPPRHSDNQVSERYVTVDEEQADGSPPALAFNQYDAEKRVNRISSGVWYVLERGYPLNPVGRTGMGGRGALPLWGPNHAMCCAFTRVKSRPSKKVVVGKQRRRKLLLKENKPVFEILAFFDNALKKWTLPMGIFGSVQSAPADRIKRSFETLIQESQYDEEEKSLLLNKLRMLFNQGGKMIHVGYYDSAYNTDNAWIETCCLAFHDSEGCTADLDRLEGFGVEAEWIDFHNEALFYGGQRSILRQLADDHVLFFPLKH